MIIVVILSSIIMAYADRWFGTGNKLRGQIAGSIAIAFVSMYSFNQNYYAPDWVFIPILISSILAFLSLRQWGIWGELFPNGKRKARVKKHMWFYKLCQKVLRIDERKEDTDGLIRWKRLSWGVRYAIYGLPIAVLFSICGMTIAPMIMVTVAGFIRGSIYEYGLNEGKGLPWCELWAGGVTMLIMGLSA